MDALPFPEIYYKKGEEFIRIELSTGRRSIEYPLPTSEAFGLFIPKADGAYGTEMELVGNTPLKSASKRMLFLVGKAPTKSKHPLAIIGVDDSLDTFPAGTFRFANFTNKSLKIAFGNVEQGLAPRSIEVFKARMAPNGGLMTLLVSDAKGNPVFGRRLFGQPRDRSMVFIVPAKEQVSGLKIKILSEIIPIEAPKTP